MPILMQMLVHIGQIFFDVRDFGLSMVEVFSEKEDLARERVVVIGADVPKELKTSYRAMLNNELMINGIPYKVIGVLKSRGQGHWESPDDEVYVPLMTASARIFGSKKFKVYHG